MKIHQKQNKKWNKVTLVVSAILVVLLAAYGGAALKLNLWPFTKSTEPVLTEEQKEAANSRPTNTSKESAGKDNSSSDNGTKTTDQVPVDTSLSASITQLSQDQNNVTFTAAVKNSNSTGTCVINFTNENDRPVTRQVDSTLKDNVNVCGPIIVPNLEFSYLGQWTVQFTFYSNGKQVVLNDKINIR